MRNKIPSRQEVVAISDDTLLRSERCYIDYFNLITDRGWVFKDKVWISPERDHTEKCALEAYTYQLKQEE